VGLGLLEAGLRIFRPVRFGQFEARGPRDEQRVLLHRRSTVPGLLYELAPGVEKDYGGVSIRTNSFGMRDDEPERGGEPLARIVVLGDSFTFGQGVAGEDTYPNVLERLLNGSASGAACRFEVLNLGVEGYATRDEAVVFREKALAWKPRLAIVGYTLNDPDTDPLQPLNRYFHTAAWWEHSHLLRRLVSLKRNWDIRRLGGADYVRYLHADPRKWGSVVTAFRDIQAHASVAGCRLLLAIFPIIPRGTWDGYAYDEMHDQVARAGAEAGFRVVDLREAFSKRRPDDLIVSEGDRHPNRLGHLLAAETIFEEISKEGVPQCP
jgi:hypothetical protein